MRSATSRYTAFAYDTAGNTRFELTKPSAGASQVTGERASFYASDERLLAIDRRSSGRRVLEESRYDALGRRVWASTTTYCAPTSALSCLTNAVRRVVWDGSAIVAELRAPRDTATAGTEELDTGFPLLPATALGDPNPFYGRVVYAPGLATDEPLSVTRYAYRDNPAGGTSLTWPTYSLVPHWDYRGTPVYGLYADGAAQKPYTLGGGQTACPAPGATTTQRCVYLTWPFAGDPYNRARGSLVTLSWQGSLLELQRDGAGLEYKRNRVYDPETGRFTQEDPIGLGGGLNAYGYANGDPVNYSDPFGLCPWCGILQRAGAAVSAVGRYGQQFANVVRGWVASPAAQQAAGVADDLAERVAARSNGAWDVAVAGGRHAGLLRTYGTRAISEIQSGIASLEGRATEHLGKIRDPSSVVPNSAQLDPRAQRGMLKFWEKEAVNYSQQAEVLRGMLRP